MLHANGCIIAGIRFSSTVSSRIITLGVGDGEGAQRGDRKAIEPIFCLSNQSLSQSYLRVNTPVLPWNKS